MDRIKLSAVLLFVGFSTYASVAWGGIDRGAGGGGGGGGRSQTLFNEGMSYSGYGALTQRYSQVTDQNLYLLGLRGGWIINHELVFGGAFYGPLSSIEHVATGQKATLSYAGATIEYWHQPFDLVHLGFGVLLGGGNLSLRAADLSFRSNLVFVAEPIVEGVVNIFEKLRLSVGVGYRFTRNVHLADYSSNQWSGMSLSANLALGVF